DVPDPAQEPRGTARNAAEVVAAGDHLQPLARQALHGTGDEVGERGEERRRLERVAAPKRDRDAEAATHVLDQVAVHREAPRHDRAACGRGTGRDALAYLADGRLHLSVAARCLAEPDRSITRSRRWSLGREDAGERSREASLPASPEYELGQHPIGDRLV